MTPGRDAAPMTSDASSDSPPLESKTARIDPAHAVPHRTKPMVLQPLPLHQPASDSPSSLAPAPQRASDAQEQLAAQATDLAERLTLQAADLDRRAAMLASQEAEIETRLRQARLWFEERHRELEEREQTLKSGNPVGHAPPAVNGEEAAERTAEIDRRHASLAAEQELVEQQLGQVERRESEVQSRQRDLDGRQARLYHEIEELTSQRAQLADALAKCTQREDRIAEQQAKIAAIEDELERKSRDLGDRAAELQLQAAELKRKQADQDIRDEEISGRELQINFRQREIEHALKRFERLGVTEKRLVELQEESNRFRTRSRYLDEAEALLTEQQAQVSTKQQHLDTQRRELQEGIVAERRTLAAGQDKTRREAHQRQTKQNEREAELDRREAALKQLQSELQTSQREALELRVAVEETWGQLAGALAPASLSRSIAQTRGRLADQFELVLREIAQDQAKLESLRRDVSHEHERLEQQRRELTQWATRREQDIEERASRLLSRESELDRQQAYYEQLESRWHLERDDYRREIRELLAELRQTELQAA